MKVSDIISPLEEFAPLYIQEGFDNAGLIVGSLHQNTRKALLCVDVTEEVMDEADAVGADMIISHHPIIFHAIKKLNGQTFVERVVERAIKSGMAIYASHTNLDSAEGGMSFRLAEILGVKNAELLVPSRSGYDTVGLGVVGALECPVPAKEYLQFVKERLCLSVIRHSDICRESVREIAICTGAGASFIDDAAEAGADLYLSADFKYNDFMDADGRLIAADIGHFESEYCAIDLMYDIIRKKIPNFALHKSERSRNPINYIV